MSGYMKPGPISPIICCSIESDVREKSEVTVSTFCRQLCSFMRSPSLNFSTSSACWAVFCSVMSRTEIMAAGSFRYSTTDADKMAQNTVPSSLFIAVSHSEIDPSSRSVRRISFQSSELVKRCPTVSPGKRPVQPTNLSLAFWLQ
ncbi:hypothetical protein SDC9_140742 [bioreactor metagenome]|uniref:Uncharacterized protein n=1 Tax=bioreactor metagenome TaxID=1076179 RepID=A0A645DZ42_9ZZZZ